MMPLFLGSAKPDGRHLVQAFRDAAPVPDRRNRLPGFLINLRHRKLMKNTLLFPALAVCLLAGLGSLHAEVPPLINYQGRVAVGTTNFEGSGQFKFALVNDDGSTTYWTNDGTASGEPVAAVGLTVAKGLYSVLLGDASIANMTAIPPGVFAEDDVRLRVWFNDGVNGFQMLAPDQRIAAAGYALMAAGVNLPTTSAPGTNGVILQNDQRLLHSFGTDNFFAGRNSGNFTLMGNSNVAIGVDALSSITSGSQNTATGRLALFSNSEGVSNTAVGHMALRSNTVGNWNTANGHQALFSNTTGLSNTAIGLQTLYSNTEGNNNTAIGRGALYFNTTGISNTAIGQSALLSNTTGLSNTASGRESLRSNTTGNWNTANGHQSLYSNTTGQSNTASGLQSLFSNTEGINNTATGRGALYYNTTGVNNTGDGHLALHLNTTGSWNSGIGHQVLYSNTIGNSNGAFGLQALFSNTGGNNNTGIGRGALYQNTSGSNNIAVGFLAGQNLTTGNDNIAIGHFGVAGESATIRIGESQARAFVAGVRGTITGLNDAVPIVIDSVGQLGTVSSSRRYKEDIHDLGEASARIGALRPVSFRYRKPFADGEKPVQYGLIAEEVAEVFPELAVRNAEGEPETVKYQDLAPLLLNEVQKLMSENAELKLRLAEREAELEERFERIEAQLREAKP